MWVAKMKENGEYHDGSGDDIYLCTIDTVEGIYYGVSKLSWAERFNSVEELTDYVVDGGMDIEEIIIMKVSE